MRTRLAAIAVLAWGLCGLASVVPDTVEAHDRRPASLAATAELPAALRAVAVEPAQILTKSQAAEVRGEWIMTVNLPYFAAQLQGTQPFTLQLWTIGAGIAPGTPVYIRVSVGH